MAEQQDTAENEEAEGGNKKLIIIIAAVVLLLVIGGAAAFFLLSGDDAADGQETAEEVAAPEEDLVPTYYAIPKPKQPGLIITLTPGTSFKNAQVNLTLFTQSPAMADYLALNDPMIRHHIVDYLSTEKSALFVDRKGREQIQKNLRDRLVEVIASSPNEADKVLAEKLENIYFTKFVLQ